MRCRLTWCGSLPQVGVKATLMTDAEVAESGVASTTTTASRQPGPGLRYGGAEAAAVKWPFSG